MTFDLDALTVRPGDLVYIREDRVGLAERVASTKARAMSDETISIVRGPTDPEAEALATIVIDEAGRLIKDRRGENTTNCVTPPLP